MTNRDRRGAERRGRRAETLAKWWLRLHGYAILAARYKRPFGEIDIIARRRHTLVFVEVKQRRSIAAAQEAVPERAWQRIARAAEAWCATQRNLPDWDYRFDLIAISSKGIPKHFRDYWRP
ncbi:MAG: YraN family protein [Pseudomonadota bacterium]